MARRILNWIESVARVWRREFKIVFSDAAALLFFIGLPLFYPIVYTLIYNPEIVQEIPFSVVDGSRSAKSRELVRMADATQSMKFIGYASSLEEARGWMNEKACYGIMVIPEDYAVKIGRGEQAVVPFYYETSLLLRYRGFLSALTDVQLAAGAEIRQTLIDMAGDAAASIGSVPADSHEFFLGDISQGFASFVIPGILILVLQQSIVLGVTTLGGTGSERRRRNNGADPLEIKAGVASTMIGKALCYLVIYLPVTVYLLHIVPALFHFPHTSNCADYFLFALPLLLSSIFFGMALQVFVKERESAMLVVVFSSVVFLFLSGLTWPRYAIGFPWLQLGDLVPATWGIEGYVRISSNDALLSQASLPYIMLWILTLAYFVVALVIGKLRKTS